MERDAPENLDHRAHASLRAIALVEVGKGVLALLAASSIATFGAVRIDKAIDPLASLSHFDTIQRTLSAIASDINPASVQLVTAMIAAYGALRLAEGWGLCAHGLGHPDWAPFRSRSTFPSIWMHRPAIQAGSHSSRLPSNSRYCGY